MRFSAVAVVGLMVAAMAQAQQAKAPVVIGPIVLVESAQQAKGADSQVPTEQQKKATVILQVKMAGLNGSSCPGALQAQQQATGGATVWTTALGVDSAAARPQGLGIHVEFEGLKTEVKGLELQVSYLPLGLHAMQVSPTMTNSVAAQPQERAKTFNLDRVAAMRIGGDLLVGPAATITRVHLVSATFADGTVWRASSDDACTVVPSRRMLVASK